MATGSLDKAREFYGKGLNVPTPHIHIQRPHYLLGQAQITLVQHDLDEAARLVDEARAYAEARGMQHFYPFIAYADGQVSATRGDDERALTQFARAEELGLPMKLRPLVWRVRSCAADALVRVGRADEAQAKRRQAQAMMDEIAGLFQSEELRQAFLESASYPFAASA
jgi:ATP/maltotriose-dependent transcriptional regulator MalT